jgi:hypothetical protein
MERAHRRRRVPLAVQRRQAPLPWPVIGTAANASCTKGRKLTVHLACAARQIPAAASGARRARTGERRTLDVTA